MEEECFGVFERVWERVASEGNVFSPRTGHTVAVWRDRVYLFGGTDRRRRRQDVFCFDCASRQWEELATKGPVPCRRSGAGGVILDGKFYIGFGYDGRDGNFYNDLHELNLETLTWRTIISTGILNTEIPSPRTDHCLEAYGEKSLVLFGGYDGHVRFDDVHIFDLETEKWGQICKPKVDAQSKLLPSARFGHSGVVRGDELFVFGGWNGRDTLSEMWKLNLKTETWTAISKQGSSESIGHPRENSSHFRPFYALSKRRCVEASPSRPDHRYRHSAVLVDNHMVIYGGVNKAHMRFCDLYSFDLDTFAWERLKPLGNFPVARTFHKAVLVGSDMYVLGGYDGTDRLNEVHRVYLGNLSPPPLLELAARKVRRNLNSLKFEDLSVIPPFVVESVLWTRDCDGNFRGGSKRIDACGELKCQNFLPSSCDKSICIVCEGHAYGHDLIEEKSLWYWQPEIEGQSSPLKRKLAKFQDKRTEIEETKEEDGEVEGKEEENKAEHVAALGKNTQNIPMTAALWKSIKVFRPTSAS